MLGQAMGDDSETEPPRKINIIVNWFEELMGQDQNC